MLLGTLLLKRPWARTVTKENDMYKATAKKNRELVNITRLEVIDSEIYAIHYVNNKGQITWDFPEDLDNLAIEYIGGSK
jgi:hypothetical protein